MNKPTYEQLEAQVKQLAAERDAVVAENAAMKAACSALISKYMANRGSDSEFIACFTPEKSTIGTGGVWDMWRSLERLVVSAPATDAILAYLRAEGVEMYANNVLAENMSLSKSAGMETTASVFAHLEHEAKQYAAQLRSKSEVQS